MPGIHLKLPCFKARESIMRMYVVITAALIGISAPVLAAEYYVVKDSATGRCKVSDDKPDGQARVMVGTATYATKEEAKSAMKSNAECEKKKKKDASQ
jgi:hypothetical protein